VAITFLKKHPNFCCSKSNCFWTDMACSGLLWLGITKA
jgi:hypothetical protein